MLHVLLIVLSFAGLCGAVAMVIKHLILAVCYLVLLALLVSKGTP